VTANSVTVTATDLAGNTATATVTFTVTAPVLFGSSVNATTDLDRWKQTTGRPLPVVRVFFTGALPATWAASPLLAALPVGTVVVVSFKSGTPAAVQAFLASRPPGQAVYACYYHEPEDDIEAGTLALADFRANSAAYAQAIRAAGCVPMLILMDWTLNTGPAGLRRSLHRVRSLLTGRPFEAGSGRNWRDYYQPGTFGALGVDSYNPGRKQTPAVYTDYAAKMIPPIVSMAAEAGLPWGLAEFGSPIIGADVDRVAWVRATRQALADAGAVVVCWWDVNRTGFDNSASAAVMQTWGAP
jgi:hypothetical protein